MVTKTLGQETTALVWSDYLEMIWGVRIVMSLDEQNERVFLLNEEQMVATRWLRINEILGPRRSFEFCLE